MNGSNPDSTSTPLGLFTKETYRLRSVFLGDTLGARLGSYPVDTVYRRVQGVIENSFI